MSNQPTFNEPTSLATATAPTAGDSSNFQDQPQAPQGPAPGLYAPSLTYNNFPDNAVSGIVARIMSPPEYLYSRDGQTVTFHITWVVGVAGPERFQCHSHQDRHVLRREDDLHKQGKEAGLSAEIMEWLEGGEETLTLPATHFE